MKTSIKRIIIYCLGIALIFIIFSFFIGDGKPQYAMEIASAFMGCIITVIITYILLNKQTENELEKERNAKIVEEKIKVYDDILSIIKSVLYEGKIERKQKLELQLVNLKLVQIASTDVIEAFQLFSVKFKNACEGDDEITNDELPNLLEALLSVCVKIREDIANPDKPKDNKEALEQLSNDATATIRMFEIDSKLEFDALCQPEENKYFDEIKRFIESRPEFSKHPGKVGFSIKKSGKPIVWYYPITPTTPNNLIFHIENLSDESKSILKESKNANFNMKRSPLKLADMPIERLKKLLEVA